MTDEAEAKKRTQCIEGASVTVVPFRAYGDRNLGLQDIRKFVPDERVAFAMAIIEKHALVAARADGEDSTGRQKGELLTPAEIVSKACDISERAFAEFEARGWRQLMPAPDELLEMSRANSEKN
jgi:hypothetical protein